MFSLHADPTPGHGLNYLINLSSRKPDSQAPTLDKAFFLPANHRAICPYQQLKQNKNLILTHENPLGSVFT
jgi:hypothetical protein